MRSAEALRAGLLHLLEHKPFDQITVRDIAAAAGVNYTTFFRHYPTKEALLHDLASDEMRRLVELTLPVFNEVNVAAANLALFSYIEENRSLWTALLTGGASGALRDEQLRLSQLVAAEFKNDQESWLPLKLGVNCTASIIFETLVWWLDQPTGSYTIAEASEILNRLIGNRTLTASR